MTNRDVFAAHALSSILEKQTTCLLASNAMYCSQLAYHIADAMIEARSSCGEETRHTTYAQSGHKATQVFTDVVARGYCERIAKAAPERFSAPRNGEVDSNLKWGWYMPKLHNELIGLELPGVDSSFTDAEWWAFIGPLAVELGVHRVTLECPLTGEKYADLLEATFAAVCDRLEADA